MPLGEQLVAESVKRNDTWLHEQGKRIYEMIHDDSTQKKQDLICWNMYNEKINQGDFDYLRKVSDVDKKKEYTLPAKVRFIGVVRPRLNSLISQQARRDFQFSVVSIDKESIKKKYNEQILNTAREIDNRVKFAYNTILSQINAIILRKSELEMALRQDPKDQKSANQLEGLRKAMPMIEFQFNLLTDRLQREKLITEEDIQELELKMRYQYKDYRESLAQKSLHHLRQVLRIKEESRQAFIEKLVLGKEYFYVDYFPGDRYPIFKKVSSQKVYFPKGGINSWTQHGSWVLIREFYTPSQVIDEYGKYLTSNERKTIEQSHRAGGGVQSMNSYADNKASFESTDSLMGNVYEGSATGDANIEVVKLWWKSQRKETAKKTPNKYREGKYFTNYVKETDRDKPLKQGESVHERYLSDIYCGVIIDRNMYVKFGKKPFQIRPIDTPSHVELPVYGKSFNDSSEAPYSLIWATKDIQILYNLVCYHEELLLALSGVKGFIMDRSQKPDDMSDAEWAYQRKVGTGWIQTIKSGNRVNPVYNQFASYDDTLSDAVVTLNTLKDRLIESVRDITGVTREREGITVPTDQVGTYKMSQISSNLITEYLFYEHDIIESEALRALINIDAYLVSVNGDVRHYFDSDRSQIAFKIPPGVLDKANYDVLVLASPKDEQALQDLKGFAIGEHNRGALSFSELIEVYNTPILTDLQKKIEHFAEIAERRLAQNAQAQAESEKQAELENTKLNKEYEKAIQDSKNLLEKLSLDLDSRKHEWEKQKEAMELGLKEKELDLTNRIELYKTATENAIESQQLSDNDKHQTIDEIIRLAEMRINAALEQAGIAKDIKLGNMKTTKDKVGGGQPREHISD